jgi:DNA-binding transcriptional regulator YiaG
MTPTQFRAALDQLGLSQRQAAIAFGISWRQINRYAQGVSKIPEPLIKLLKLTLEQCRNKPNKPAAN